MGDQNFMGGLLGGLAQGLQVQQETALKKEYQKSIIDINKLHGKLFEAQARAAELKTQGLPQSIIEAMNKTDEGAAVAAQAAQPGAMSQGAPGQPGPQAQAQPLSPAPMWGQGRPSLPVQMAGGQVQIPGDPANNISVRQNNPFNLKHVGQEGSLGAGTRGFAAFPTPEIGVQAGIKQIQLDQSRGLPFAQFAEKYAPAYENPGWAADVAKLVGISDPNIPINQIPTMKLAQAVAWRESQTRLPESGGNQINAQPIQYQQAPQTPGQQQLITPNFPKATGISGLKTGDRLALDVYFKQTYDLDTKFRETKGKFKLHGTPEVGYQIINEDTGQIATLPPTIQKQTRYEFTTPSGAGGIGYAPDAIRTPMGGGAPGGLGANPPALGGSPGAGPVIQTKPPVVTWEKGKTPGGGEYEFPKPQAQMGMNPIVTGPEKGANASESGRIQLAQSGLSAHQELEKMIFDINTGKSQWKALATGIGPGVPWTEGRNIKSLIFRASDAIIRAATGAALNQEELKQYAETYAPSVFDNEATIQSKMQGLRQFLNGYLEKMDPTEAARLRMGPIVGPMGKSGFNAPAISSTSKVAPTNPTIKRENLPDPLGLR